MSSPNFNPGPTLPQRLVPETSPFQQLQARIFDYLHTAAPAVVVAFTPGPPATVNVQLVMNDVSQQNSNAPNFPVNLQQTSEPIQVLQDLPVVFPSGGGWGITFPIAAGDECLVIFADVDFDAWWQSGYQQNGGNTPQQPSLKHSLSNGIAIFGLRSTPNGWADWSTDSMEIRNADGSIVVKFSADGGVAINGTSLTVSGEFGCNGESAQPPYPSGGPSLGTLAETTTLANNIRAALVACGLMS